MKESETLVATVPMATAQDLEPVDEQRLGKEVTDIEFQAEALVVSSEDDYKAAGEFGVMLKRKAAQVVSFFKPMKDSAYQAHKAVCDREKAMLAPLKNAETIVKKSMAAYVEEQERKRRELEEAQRRAAEAERERKLREAEELEAAGDKEGAESAISEAVIMDEASTYSVPAFGKPKAAGVSTTKDWEITGIDPKAVPLVFSGVELRPVDTAAVMRLIRASKGKIEIPGITYRQIAKMSFSRR